MRSVGVTLPRREPPQAGARRVLTRHGPSRPSGACVYLDARVLLELESTAAHRPGALQVGFLLGAACEGTGNDFVEVGGFAELVPWNSLEEWRDTTRRDWNLTTNRMRRVWPTDRVVGWVILAPGADEALLGEAEMLHRSFFGLPWQVLLVLDTESRTLALRVPSTEGHLVSSGFVLVTPLGNASLE